jgi:PAS domain S-box-containing protein
VETANDAIISTDADTGLIIEANRKAGELLRLPVNQLVGKPQTELHPPDEAEHHRREFQDRIRTGSASVSESVLWGRDGRRIPVEVSFSAAEIEGRSAAPAARHLARRSSCRPRR